MDRMDRMDQRAIDRGMNIVARLVEPSLLPCPFCGGKAKILDGYQQLSSGYQREFGVWCTECDAQTSAQQHPMAARTKWNRRAERLPKEPGEGIAFGNDTSTGGEDEAM